MSDLTYKQILSLEVPIIVRVAERKLRVSEITALVPGSIIELTKNAEEELDLLVHNRHVGFGEAVKVGENFGIRVTFIGDVRERLEAVGGWIDAGNDDGANDAARMMASMFPGA